MYRGTDREDAIRAWALKQIELMRSQHRPATQANYKSKDNKILVSCPSLKHRTLL